MGWFGGGAAAKKDAPKNAILGLRSTLDMLTKREKHLQNQMDEQDALARKNVNTNKTGMWYLDLKNRRSVRGIQRETTHFDWFCSSREPGNTWVSC